MKVSEVTVAELKAYCRAEDEEDGIFQIILDACKAYIIGQTGLTAEQMEQYEDLTMAILILGSDMYDNRTYHQKDMKANLAVKAIIDQYQRNIL